MLYGQKDLVIDDKGRLTLPSLFRNEFGSGNCYASLGLDKCILIYTEESYKKYVDKILQLSEFDDIARRVQRTFLSNSYPLQIDSHNRILLPKLLANKTKAEKKVVVVGMYDHLEIWDSEAFAKNIAEGEANYSSDAKSLIQ